MHTLLLHRVLWFHEVMKLGLYKHMALFPTSFYFFQKVGLLDNPTVNMTGSCSYPLVCTATHYFNQYERNFQCLKAI